MSDTEKQSQKRRVYLLIFLQLLVPGIVLCAGGIVVSLFRTGRVAEYIRFAALLIFLIGLVGGALRAFLVFALNRWRNRKGLDDIY
jgi:FtsH-binding integral membrane protein